MFKQTRSYSIVSILVSSTLCAFVLGIVIMRLTYGGGA